MIDSEFKACLAEECSNCSQLIDLGLWMAEPADELLICLCAYCQAGSSQHEQRIDIGKAV